MLTILRAYNLNYPNEAESRFNLYKLPALCHKGSFKPSNFFTPIMKSPAFAGFFAYGNFMNSEVTINSNVLVKLNSKVRSFKIVSSAEVDIASNKISYLSPIGQVLLGKKTGEVFLVELLTGELIEGEVVKVF